MLKTKRNYSQMSLEIVDDECMENVTFELDEYTKKSNLRRENSYKNEKYDKKLGDMQNQPFLNKSMENDEFL
jgi:hypothetical protein